MIKNFYVYCYMNPLKPGRYTYENINFSFLYEPFYIGKGSNNRINRHTHSDSLSKDGNVLKCSIIKKIKNENLDIIKIKLYDDLKENDSLYIEMDLIKNIGRRDTKKGPLSNLTDGGEKGMNQNRDVLKKSIDQYDLSGKLVEKYDSIRSASKKLKIYSGGISSCCNRKSQTYRGYVWRFSFDVYDQPKTHDIPIFQKIEDKIVEYESIKSFCDINKKVRSNVTDMLRGKRKNILNIYYQDQLKENIFSEKRIDKEIHKSCIPIVQLDRNDQFIKDWNSATEIEKVLGYSASSIIGCCKKRRKTLYGFIWRYKNIN
jgi:hypothetical protein